MVISEIATLIKSFTLGDVKQWNSCCNEIAEENQGVYNRLPHIYIYEEFASVSNTTTTTEETKMSGIAELIAGGENSKIACNTLLKKEVGLKVGLIPPVQSSNTN